MTAPKMTPVEGKCPLQAYGTCEGWLLYFRARDVWDLSAYAPGKWDPSKPVTELPTHDYFRPDAVVDEGDEDDGFPDDAGEHDYPGWWSDEYGERVLAWALGKMAVKAGWAP